MPELWIPHDPGRTSFVCGVCGAEFPEYQKTAWGRHVKRCSDKHADDIAALSRRNDPLVAPLDPEKLSFYKEHGGPNRAKGRSKGVIGH
jgi:hypothetical protein